MKEYGGYIEWETYYGEEFHKGYRVDSVRSALAYSIKKRGYMHIWIPYYICSCIQELLEAIPISFSRYHITEKFLPILPAAIPETHCVLVVNYYDQLQENDIKTLAQKYNIFLDNTQAFFEMPIADIDMANSCRKFFGVTGGGYFYTTLNLSEYESYDRDTAYDKATCLIGRYEKNASDFYQYFIKNEAIKRGHICKKMSKFVQNILKSLDYEEIIKKRKENFDSLEKILGRYNELLPVKRAGLFMYPFLLENGKEVKQKLINEKIYVPTLWPGVEKFSELNPFEKQLISNLVLLPIDQRYDVNDMQYIGQRVLKLI